MPKTHFTEDFLYKLERQNNTPGNKENPKEEPDIPTFGNIYEDRTRFSDRVRQDVGLELLPYENKVKGLNEFEGMPANRLQDASDWRTEQQSWYEQTGSFLGQAVLGEVIGGTLMSIGATMEAPVMLHNHIVNQKNDWDNAIFSLGKNISDWSREAMPIYQTGDRFGDWGWYMQGLVSSASTLSMMLPGIGTSKAIGGIAKALKLAKTPSAVASTMLGAGSMRHAENFREASELYKGFQLSPEEEQLFVEKYDKMMQQEMNEAGVMVDPENPEAASAETLQIQEQIRNKYADLAEQEIEDARAMATTLAYNANWINYGFDLLQLGTVLRPFKGLTRGGTLSHTVAKAHDATLKVSKALPKSRLGKIAKRLYDPAKVGLAEYTEGLEEIINTISAIEGEHAARVSLGVEKPSDKSLAERVVGYLGEEEVQDAFIWGMVGGIMFKGASKALGFDASKGINERKLAEIANRSKTLEGYATTLKAIRDKTKLADSEGNIVRDYSKLTDEQRAAEEQFVLDKMFHEKGVTSAKAGTIDIDIEWLQDPKTAKQFIDMGLADASTVQEKINGAVAKMEEAEQLYKKYYEKFYESQIKSIPKAILIERGIALEQQMSLNQSRLNTLDTRYNKLLTSDPYLKQNAQNSDIMNAIRKEGLMLARLQLLEDLNENKGNKNLENVIRESINEIKSLEDNIVFSSPLSKTFGLHSQASTNIAEKVRLETYNKVLNKEIQRLSEKKEINKEAGNIERDLKKQKENIERKAQQEQIRKIKKQENQLKEAGYTAEQIDKMSASQRTEILKTLETQPTQTSSTPKEGDTGTVNWTNLIEKATSEKELDAIIDQMDKANVEPDFDTINKKRKEFTPAQVSEEDVPSDVEGEKTYESEIFNLDMQRTQEIAEIEERKDYSPEEKENAIEEINTLYDKKINALKPEFDATIDPEDSGLQPDNTDLEVLLGTFEDGKNPDISNETVDQLNKDISAELPEAEFNFKRVVANAIINLVRRHRQDTQGGKLSTDAEVANKEALILSEWETLKVGTEVRVSVDIEYDGPTNQYYDDGRQVLDKGKAVTENITYGDVKQDPDKLPIKIEVKREGNWVKVGYLPTTAWVGEKTADGNYANIANEAESMEGNGEVQVKNITRLRQQIANIQHGTPLTFNVVSKSNGTLFKDGKNRDSIDKKTPKFLKSGYWEESGTAPFTIFNKGFMINSNLRFDPNNSAINHENIDDIFPPGSLVMMIPSAAKGNYIPRTVNLNNISIELSEGIAEVLKAYMNNDKKALSTVFNKTGLRVDGLKNLKAFLEQFMYFTSIEEVMNTTTNKPRIAFDFDKAEIIVTEEGKVASRIALNRFRKESNPEAVQKQLETLIPALQRLRVTARISLLNKEEDFYTPRMTEEGGLDFNTTTYNEHLSKNATTDIVENSYDENSAPVYSIQPVVEIEWSSTDKIDPKPQEKQEVSPVEKETEGEVFDWSDINTEATKEILGDIDAKDALEIEDSAIGVTEFYNLNEGKHLYAAYNLLNKKGELKVVPNNKATKKWVDTLNKSPNYNFKLRPTRDGKHRILIVKDPLKESTHRVEDSSIGIPTISNVFESNSELANQVYEVLGFDSKPEILEKNIFTVNPIQSVDKKAKYKAKFATQYIGFAEGIKGSSTALYATQAGKYSNTGNYSSNDVIFVSIGGKRGNETIRKQQQDKTIKEAVKAIEAGATLITDNKAYVESSSYNEGEKRLAENLEASGYTYSEFTVDNNLLGVWAKSDKRTTQQEQQAKELYSEYLNTGRKDIQGFKEFINAKNASPQVPRDKYEHAYSYIVTDGDFRYNASNQQEITDMIASSVFAKLLEAEESGQKISVGEAFNHSKDILREFKKVLDIIDSRIQTNEALERNKQQPSFPEEFKFLRNIEHIKFLQKEFNRVLKENVFKQFQLQVQDKLRTLNISAQEETVTDEVIGAETTIERTWDDTSHLKMFSRDTATQKVKLALSKIRTNAPNYLGIKGYVPFDTVFDDVTSVLSTKPLDNTLEQNVLILKKVALNNPYKGYLSQVAKLLESPNVSQSLKNGFQSVIRRNNNNYVVTIWNKGDRGWNYTPLDANRNNIVNRIVESWNEFFGNSSVVREEKGVKLVDKQKLKELGLTTKDIKDLKTDKEREEFTTKLFNSIGVQIPDAGLNALINSKGLEKDFGIKFPGGFQSQFTFTTKGEPNGLISNIVYALNAEEKITDADVAFEVNNPFIGRNSERAIKALASIMANYSEVIYSDSHRNVNGDLVNNYSFYTPETLRIKSLENKSVRKRLLQQPLTKNSFFLRSLEAGEKITYSLEDGLRQDGKRKGIGRPKMSNREQKLLALGLFQQINPKYISLTHSDKSGTPLISAPKVKFSINTEALEVGVDNITRLTKEALPPQFRNPQAKGNELVELILSESRRIQHILELEETNTPKELKRELGGQYYEGAKYFYFFPQLNALVRDDNGNIDISKLKDIDVLLDSVLDKVVETVNNTIEEWYNDGTISYDKDTKKWSTRFNEVYYNNLDSKNLPNKIVEAAADIDINYLIFNTNMMMLVMDDPAKMFKKSKLKNATPVDHVNTSLDDYQKRAAKDMAPGALGYWNWKVGDYQGDSNYGVVYVEDVEYSTLMEGYLNNIEAYSEGNIPRTDAQELTTLEEHIDVMFSYGKLPDNIYKSIKEKVIAGRGKDYKLTSEEMEYVLQPAKPVQIVRKWNNEYNLEETHYIKSSSFPLIPELTLNTDLDSIRVAMETSNTNGGKGVQRIAFKSAVKVGAKRVNSLFSSTGIINEKIEFTEDDVVILNREGFFIQQEIPYDSEKYKIVSASQINKLWLQGLNENLEFQVDGKTYKTKELNTIKENVRGQLLKMSARETYKKLGVSLIDGEPVFEDLSKVREALVVEAKQRGWGLNDIEALRIVEGKIAIPLPLNNSANRIESLLLSVFNGIVKQKISGFSAVQGTSVGLRQTRDFDVSKDKIGGKEGLVLIPDTEGNPLFDIKKGLQYTDLVGAEEDVKLAQVFIPWKFKAKLQDFTTNGILDISKIDPELLKVLGFRIPTQGHSSMIMFQVVGFVPRNMGDLMLVPGEITTQMGSDFDVDKMYNYIFNNVVSDSGQLVKIPGMELVEVDSNFKITPNFEKIRKWKKDKFKNKWSNKNTLAKKVADFLSTENNEVTISEIHEKWTNERLDFQDLDFDSVEARLMDELDIMPEDVNVPSDRELARMILENAYIEVLGAALSHKEVIKQSLKPLDRNDLKDTGNKFKKEDQKPLFISRTRQLNDYIKQRAGKEGVGVYSRAVTGLAVIENYDVSLTVPFDGFQGISLTNLSGQGFSKFENEIRTKADNLVTQQSGAVDNAKDPVLDNNHLNMQTFNASIILSMLERNGEALNLEWNSYFLRQEIIKDYVNEMEKLSDTVNEDYGTGTRQEQVVEKLQKRYLKRVDLDSYTREKDAFSLKDLTDMLMEEDTSTVEYVKAQLEVLERFVELDTIGQEYSTFLSAISTDSKGFGKNFFELAKRREQLNQVRTFKFIQGLDKVLENSEHGIIGNYVREVSNSMSQLFPYMQRNVVNVIANLETLSGKDEYIDVEFRETIWKNLKSFIFTNPNLETVGDRQELFYGKNSLAHRVAEAKETWGSGNLFIRKLNTIFAKEKGKPDLVTFTASLVERTDEINTVRHFTDLFTSDIQEIRDFAESLVQYAYLSGGIQEALQFIKYIPTAYLTNTNFSEVAKEGLNTFNPDIFIEQFIQHNPHFASKYEGEATPDKEGRIKISIKKTSGLRDKLYMSMPKGKGRWNLYKKVEANGNTHIFQQIPTLGGKGKNYTSYKEYNFGARGVQQSTIPENNPNNLTIVEEIKVNPTPNTEEGNLSITNTSAAENRAIKYDTAKKGVQGVKDITSKLETRRYQLLGEIFSEASDLLPNFEFKIDSNLKSKTGTPNRGHHVGGKVTINPKAIKEYYELEGREVTNEDTEGVIMHELSHAVTTALHHAHSKGIKHKLLTPQVTKRIENINKFYNIAFSKLTSTEKKIVANIITRNKEALGATTAEQQRNINEYYGFTSPREFIAETMSNPAFQRKMNGIQFQKGRNLLQRFADLVTELFVEIGKVIGMTVEQNSILAHTVNEVVGVIQDTKSKDSSIQKDTTTDQTKDSTKEDLAISTKSTNLQTSVAGFMKRLSSVERDVLRSFMSKKVIKFKCT